LIRPCEVAVKSVVPAVKALVATQLVEKHGLKQDEVADILGISQSAVSRYMRKNRGHVISVRDVDDIKPLINKMTTLILAGEYERQEFLVFFCQTCVIVRKNSLMCPFCRMADPKIEIGQCGFCVTHNLPSGMR
jgi:predicted transcriptional regulator